MNSDLFLGIDTSNYTTSIALVDENRNILLNSKHMLPVQEGERGLRQSDALFHHVKNLPDSAEDLKACLDRYGNRITAVGYSKTPRDIIGSYMPCFLAGQSSALLISAALNIPAFPFSHQAGHVMAALYSASENEIDSYMSGKFLAFHVSGGTTDLLMCEPDNNKCFNITQIGGTKDINAGQAIDRTGVRMNIKFPCGSIMDKAALEYIGPKFKHKISVNETWCNLSGLENQAALLYEKCNDINTVSAYTLSFVEQTLEKMAKNALEKQGRLPIIFAGGVMSSQYIRKDLSALGMFAEPSCSSDNAVGIALLAREKYQKDLKNE